VYGAAALETASPACLVSFCKKKKKKKKNIKNQKSFNNKKIF